jgi:hypothetical protein
MNTHTFLALLFAFASSCAAFRLATPLTAVVRPPTSTMDKKIISIPPSGFLGFYVMGMCAYLKDHYDLSRVLFAGDASGGWNALFMSCRREPLTFALGILENKQLRYADTLQEWEFALKSHILTHYTDDDFDIDSLYLGVPFWQECFEDSMLVKPAASLKDAVEGCLTRMPFPWGPVPVWGDVKKSDWILWNQAPNVRLRPNMWTDKTKNGIFDFHQYYQKCASASADCIPPSPSKKIEILDLFDRGYADAMEHAADWDRLLGEEIPRKFP